MIDKLYHERKCRGCGGVDVKHSTETTSKPCGLNVTHCFSCGFYEETRWYYKTIKLKSHKQFTLSSTELSVRTQNCIRGILMKNPDDSDYRFYDSLLKLVEVRSGASIDDADRVDLTPWFTNHEDGFHLDSILMRVPNFGRKSLYEIKAAYALNKGGDGN